MIRDKLSASVFKFTSIPFRLCLHARSEHVYRRNRWIGRREKWSAEESFPPRGCHRRPTGRLRVSPVVTSVRVRPDRTATAPITVVIIFLIKFFSFRSFFQSRTWTVPRLGLSNVCPSRLACRRSLGGCARNGTCTPRESPLLSRADLAGTLDIVGCDQSCCRSARHSRGACRDRANRGPVLLYSAFSHAPPR